MVLRTYTTGISLQRIPLEYEQRRLARKELEEILHELSEENLAICQQYSEQTIEYLTDTAFLDQLITAPVPAPERNSGKFGVNGIMQICGDSRNHIHSGFHLLQIAAKGFIDRIVKFQEILKWFSDNPEELLKWIFWQRSTYAIHVFRQYWQMSFHYLDPFLRGIHHRFFGDSIPDQLPPVTYPEIIKALEEIIARLKENTDPTEGTKSYLRSLNLLKRVIIDDPKSIDWATIPSGWKNLKQWVKTLNLPKTYGISRWASIIRTLCARCYLPYYRRMIKNKMLRDIFTGKINELFSIPFVNQSTTQKTFKIKKKLPYLVVSGPKYVIRRANNKKNLHLLRMQGYFPLTFKRLKDPSWHDGLVVRVRASKKIQTVIEHPKVELKSIIILPPRLRTGDIDVQLVFKGPLEAFVATKHLKKQLRVDKRKQIAIDINRRGDYAIVTSFNKKLPQEIYKVMERWERVDKEIAKYQGFLADPPKKHKLYAYADQLHHHYRRRKNLRQTCHQMLANWVGQQLVSSGAEALLIEDLSTHTYGTRKALARAIESMADDKLLYLREVYAVHLFRGDDCRLETICAFNSSRLHVNCGGILKRSPKAYDIAPCTTCAKRVNTHYNSVLYLEAQYLGLDYKVCLSTIQAYSRES